MEAMDVTAVGTKTRSGRDWPGGTDGPLRHSCPVDGWGWPYTGGLFLAGVTIWASHRTLPAISDQSASRQQGMAAGLGSDSEPSMSDIPTANPAYPAPVESPPEAALGLYHPP